MRSAGVKNQIAAPVRFSRDDDSVMNIGSKIASNSYCSQSNSFGRKERKLYHSFAPESI